MIRRLWRWLACRLGVGDRAGTDPRRQEDASDDEESGFLPSRLDASVLEAHRLGTTPAKEELENAQAKAEMLEDERPDP